MQAEAGTFPLIDVAGSPYEMGVQHGAGHRELVLRSVATFERILAGRAQPVSMARATAFALESLPNAEAFAPELVEEVRGIADGAELDFATVFSLNASLDVLSVLSARERAGCPLNCSTYGLTPHATADGETYVGWNADDSAWWFASSVLIRVQPKREPPCLTWTFAGFVGRPGINPYLALGANGLCPSDSGRGVPYPFLCRKVLAQRSVDDAVRVVTANRRLSGMNYLLGDAAGNVASLEVTGTKSAVIAPRDGWVAHTNHYLDDVLRVVECLPADSPQRANTTSRHRRWLELFGTRTAPVAMDDLRAMHGDHDNAPDSICKHAAREGEGMTLTSLICQPRQGRMWVTHGTPCANPFVEYGL